MSQSVKSRKSWARHAAALVLLISVQTLASFQLVAQPVEWATNVAESLGLSDVVLATLAPVCLSDDVTALAVPLPGGPATLLLTRHSVRSAGYRLVVQQADGSYVGHVSGIEQTYRGIVEGIDESVVSASIVDGKIRALVQISGRDHVWIEPVPVLAQAGNETTHAIYKASSVPTVKRPGFDKESPKTTQSNSVPPLALMSPPMANQTWIAELAIDSDVEFFNRFGTVKATEAQIHAIINILNIQYERDVGIQHVISHIIIRTEPVSIYASRSASTLLYKVASFWYRFQRDVPRDTTHFFSGKSFLGRNLGVSNSAGICSKSQGYSLTGYNMTCNAGERARGICAANAECPGGSCVDSVCQSFACRTDLTAHELGHNWGLPHCPRPDYCPGWTMNPAVQGANRFHPKITVPRILDYLQTVTSCLDQGADRCEDDETEGP